MVSEGGAGCIGGGLVAFRGRIWDMSCDWANTKSIKGESCPGFESLEPGKAVWNLIALVKT